MCSGNPVDDTTKWVEDTAHDIGESVADTAHDTGTLIADVSADVGQNIGDAADWIADRTGFNTIHDLEYKFMDDMHDAQTRANKAEAAAETAAEAEARRLNSGKFTDAEIRRRRALAALRRGFLSTVKTSGQGLSSKPLLGIPALASGYKARLGA